MSISELENTPDKIETILPVLPAGLPQDRDVLALYARFMRHLRNVPSSRQEIKILSAIQFTADILGYSDAEVSKALVELGLRGPRLAFPSGFLKFIDQALMRSGWEVGGPSPALLALKEYWDRIGEDKFAAFQGDYPLVAEETYL